MNKLSWILFEQWAVSKYNKFGGEDWLDLVMWVVAKRVEWERTNHKPMSGHTLTDTL